MLYLDFEADTEKKAVQLALESLGLEREDVKIEFLNERKKSFFGLGRKEKAKIRVYYKEKNEINDIIHSVKEIIYKLDQNAIINVEAAPENRYIVNVETSESGQMIGRNGNTLEALQTIVNSILQKYSNRHKVVMDVDNYHKRSQQRIVGEAKQSARKVQYSKKSITLDPLNPFLRRLVHLELRKMRGIMTKSDGEGNNKKMIIYYDDRNSR